MKPMKKINGNGIIMLIGMVTMIFGGCQKIVNINLNDSNPRMVVEASISDQMQVDTVKLSMSVNYNQSNTFPAVSGAKVTISDNAGLVDTLTEIIPGNYITPLMQGVPGRTYTLRIVANGKTYTSSSAMPQPVPIDSLTLVVSYGRGGLRVRPQVTFSDPKGIVNYYRFAEAINDSMLTNLTVVSDEYKDGMVLTQELSARKNDGTSIFSGDSIRVDLQSIDYGAYTYFRTFNTITRGGGQNASPANPISNIDNYALGYFSAYSVRSKYLVVP